MLSRAARNLTGRIVPRTSARPFSGGHGGAEEIEKWRKISIGMSVLVVVLSAKEMLFADEHGGHHEEAQPDYMHVRNKPYPWPCSDCSLFDNPCFKKCKEERQG